MTEETNLVPSSGTESIPTTTNESNTSAQSTQTAESNTSSNTSGNAQVESTNSEPKQETRQERTFSRDEVAKITNAEVSKARERARQEALAEFESKRQPNPQTDQGTSLQGGLTNEELERRIDKIAEERQIKSQITNEAKTFTSKLDLDNDPEMKLNYQKLNLDNMNMGFVHVLNSVDNTKDIVKEFAKFPEKLTSVMQTAALFGVNAGKEALKRVSDSIKQNQAAASIKLPPEPPSQIGHSNTGVDNGQMTAADYRKKYAGRY